MYLTVVIASVWAPIVYGKYQRQKLERCEEQHQIRQSDWWQKGFAFDASFERLTGDTPEKRAAIQCILDSQDVEIIESDETEGPSLLIVGYYEFGPTLSFEYYPHTGAEDQKADSLNR
ncbi:hypothetical protein [Altererythrobacter lutimaris]|uniref:hypothetical protein n=1 Tax=Altererythrobacter lutimaris TaxID=2743979 RepID=UPI001594916B|nr:hypothetical protein [Altererythrobacter lutimaris]